MKNDEKILRASKAAKKMSIIVIGYILIRDRWISNGYFTSIVKLENTLTHYTSALCTCSNH